MNLRLFDRGVYAECRRELTTSLLVIVGRVRPLHPTPEWIAACDDVESALCADDRVQLDDELQLNLFPNSASPRLRGERRAA